MFIGVKYQILKFSQRKDVSLKLREQYIKINWQSIIEKIHKSARNKSQALYIQSNNKHNELIIGVSSTLWMQELSFYKEDIKKEINNIFIPAQDKGRDTIIHSVRLVIDQ